jgi:ribose-phosphate pyrophosphokinase
MRKWWKSWKHIKLNNLIYKLFRMFLYISPEFNYLNNLFSSKKFTVGKYQAQRYTNQEWHINVYDQVKNQTCAILSSFAPPDENLLKTLLLADTLKKEGAKSVATILPYMAYTRHDKLKPGLGLTTGWVGKMAAVSGINQIITIDLHSHQAKDLFPVPIINLSPAALFATQLLADDWGDATVVAPDEGARERAEDLRKAMKITKLIAYMKKIRLPNSVVHSELIGDVSQKVIIADDILDTGATLISACQQLLSKGVKQIAVAVTHGAFTAPDWKQLFNQNVKMIYCTNSIPTASYINHKKIMVLPIDSVLQPTIEKLS